MHVCFCRFGLLHALVCSVCCDAFVHHFMRCWNEKSIYWTTELVLARCNHYRRHHFTIPFLDWENKISFFSNFTPMIDSVSTLFLQKWNCLNIQMICDVYLLCDCNDNIFICVFEVHAEENNQREMRMINKHPMLQFLVSSSFLISNP